MTVRLIAATLLAGLVLGTAACGDPATPDVCATTQASDGTWREEDGEELDADPCDTDDAFEVDKPKSKKTKPAKKKP